VAYRFKIDERVEKGFRRIAGEQLAIALAELDAAGGIEAKGVHEFRKALKRLRALVRLASSALDGKCVRRRTKALGEIARLLSDRRDNAVMRDTVAKLTAESDGDTAAALAPLHPWLARLSAENGETFDADDAAEAKRLLLREVKKFSRIRLRGRGFQALEGGLEESYRRARKAIRVVDIEPTDENFHSLRKAVQWHWRQMNLLSRAWPEEFAVRAAAAHELSQVIGDDHDLAVLIDAVENAEDIPAESKPAILAVCRQRQEALRQTAEPRAARLFAEKPKAFVKRLSVYWKLGRAAGLKTKAIRRDEQLKPAATQTAAAEIETAGETAQPQVAKRKLAAKALAPVPSQRRA
jgi:CHAD domain-containing protein